MGGRKNNVNPDHYKTAGRERQGEDIVQEVHKQKYAQAQAGRLADDSDSNFIPGGGAPGSDTSVSSSKVTNEEVGQVNESANSSSNT